MSVSLERQFPGVPYDQIKVRRALDALTNEVATGAGISDVVASVTLPSGARQMLRGELGDILTGLAAGIGQSIDVYWGKVGQYALATRLHYLSMVICHVDAPSEALLSAAIDVFVRELGLSPTPVGTDASTQHVGSALAAALLQHDEVLWRRYVQAARDLADGGRLSYHAPMHDLRDILSAVLRDLAPDELVTTQPGYEQDSSAHGPTQTQRARYILQVLRRRGAAAATAADQAIDAISTIVRAAYSRASAAHRIAARDEGYQVLRYLDAVLGDLLGVEGR